MNERFPQPTVRPEEARPARGELRISPERFDAILDGMLDVVVTIDLHGRILTANHACAEILGYQPAELIGKNIRLLMPEPHSSQHDSHLERYRITGKAYILGNTRELPVLRKDQQVILCELSVSRIEIAGRAEPILCGSFRDVTARKQVEVALAESERRFRAIFDSEYEFVGLLNCDGTVLEVNSAALRMAASQRAEVIGRPFWETPWWRHAESERARVRDAIARAAQGEFVRFETTHMGKGGSVVNVDFSLKPVRDENGKVVLLLPEGRDITVIKQALQREHAMMKAFAEIGESASLLAHEIKSPITAVNAALRVVAKHLGEDEQVVLAELVERMQNLERLMRRTLSLTRPLQLSLAPCDLRKLVKESIATVKSQAEAARVAIEAEMPQTCPTVPLDGQLMGEVLTNLMRNAIEAMESGGKVRVKLLPSEDSLRIAVADSGPGIAESVRATLFKPFVTTKKVGNGLGLALVRKIVEAHGGTIEASNVASGGACFEIQLPLRARAQLAATPA